MAKEDKALFYQYQKGNWDEKAKVYPSFKDSVLKHFGRLLIFEENPESLSKAIQFGAEYAREALAEPKEGTILTVLTDFSNRLIELINLSLIHI